MRRRRATFERLLRCMLRASSPGGWNLSVAQQLAGAGRVALLEQPAGAVASSTPSKALERRCLEPGPAFPADHAGGRGRRLALTRAVRRLSAWRSLCRSPWRPTARSRAPSQPGHHQRHPARIWLLPDATATSLALREPEYLESAAYCRFGRGPVAKAGVTFLNGKCRGSVRALSTSSERVSAEPEASSYLARGPNLRRPGDCQWSDGDGGPRQVVLPGRPQGLHQGLRGPLHGLPPSATSAGSGRGHPNGQAAASEAPAVGRCRTGPTWDL